MCIRDRPEVEPRHVGRVKRGDGFLSARGMRWRSTYALFASSLSFRGAKLLATGRRYSQGAGYVACQRVGSMGGDRRPSRGYELVARKLETISLSLLPWTRIATTLTTSRVDTVVITSVSTRSLSCNVLPVDTKSTTTSASSVIAASSTEP